MKRNRGRTLQQGRIDASESDGPLRKKLKRFSNPISNEDSLLDIARWTDVKNQWIRFSEERYRSGFPQFVHDGLVAVRRYFAWHGDESAVELRNPDVVRQLIDEFVFGRRSGDERRRALDDLIVLKCVSSCLESGARTRDDLGLGAYVFNALFPPETSQDRKGLLTQLVSLAVSCSCSSVLDAAAECLSMSDGVAVGRALVEDFCLLLPSRVADLENVVVTAPAFITILLKAFTHIYPLAQNGVALPDLCPPSRLLPIVADWVARNPLLCCQPRFSGSTSFLPYLFPLVDADRWSCVSLPSLLRWTILGPIVLDAKANLVLSPLHTTLLKAAVQFQREKHAVADTSKGRLASDLILTMRDLVSLVPSVTEPDAFDRVQLATDRLAEAVQLTQAGSLIEIRKCLRDAKELAGKLPENKLLLTILAHWDRQRNP